MVPALRRLAKVSDVSLAVSLHAPDNALRDQLVPDQPQGTRSKADRLRGYVARDHRRPKVTWEYVMLNGVNDSIAHAKATDTAAAGACLQGQPDPVQSFPGTDYNPRRPDTIRRFAGRLMRAGIISITPRRVAMTSTPPGQLVGKVAWTAAVGT